MGDQSENNQNKLSRATCAKCDGPLVVAAVHHHKGNVVLRPEPAPLFDLRFSRLIARTCTNCGFTEFYAEEPDQL
jgi:predicted nucleic-acid-binding Zn-ribbon protein